MLGEPGDVVSVQQNLTRIDQEGPSHRIQQCGFARTIGAEDGHEAPLFDREADALQSFHFIRRVRVERLDDVTHFKHGPPSFP